MGSYLSRPRRPPVPPALQVEDLPQRQRPDRLQPAQLTRRGPVACRVHSADAAFGLARRLSYEDRVASPCCRRHRRRRFVVVYRKRLPNQLFQCFFQGVIPSALQSGHQKKPALSGCSSKMFCTSVILKMSSTKEKLTLGWALKQRVVYMWSSLSGHLPNPCVKETLMRVFGERSQVRTQEEDLKILGEIKKGPVKQEEDHIITERRDCQRRDSDGSGHVQSAFRPLVVHGAVSSFVPRPGPLKRYLHPNSSEDSLFKISQAPFINPCSKRNAIISSYSSTQDFPIMQRCGPGTTRFSGSAIVYPQVPAEKVTEESHQSSTSASLVLEKKIQGEKILDTTSGQKQHLGNCLSTPDNRSRPPKRKIPLLLPCRRGDPLIMPPAPQLGYRVTVEDFDLEKKTAIQWINKILKGKTETISDHCITQSSSSSNLPSVGITTPEPASPTPSINSLQKSLRKMQNSPGPVAFP
ncbi:PREDICTED: nuclear envelope pore membrane protein POM 121C-like [Chrysochloris asiatica]|uniref:Nuclear envelope pore membrane protein POM 121C-like n=1 Tax=Chrysochloris asiatica TaxID=185453 RepID=A0A9B0X2E0_CHRAS|nr:PREDICTED: nuclear envelope pore membrane protein POM 121C-like [Chrysochloris asiatica]